MSATLQVGFSPPTRFWRAARKERITLLELGADRGLDHVYLADHVSFHDGSGSDGFVGAAALSQLHDTLNVMIGVYLLPLRHPMPVARQIASLSEMAPGRLIFGIGVGGEDRLEVSNCGVDPATRGRRTNESLKVLRPLLRGQTIDHAGEFFTLERARIRPAPTHPVPIVVGGRSAAALRRVAHFGDGWLAVWCSPSRYQRAIAQIDTEATAAGRAMTHWQHGYQVWVGIGDTAEEARARVAERMEAFYKLPFARFERYVPYGTPEDVARTLSDYVNAGCRLLNITAIAGSDREAVEGTALIKRNIL